MKGVIPKVEQIIKVFYSKSGSYNVTCIDEQASQFMVNMGMQMIWEYKQHIKLILTIECVHVDTGKTMKFHVFMLWHIIEKLK